MRKISEDVNFTRTFVFSSGIRMSEICFRKFTKDTYFLNLEWYHPWRFIQYPTSGYGKWARLLNQNKLCQSIPVIARMEYCRHIDRQCGVVPVHLQSIWISYHIHFFPSGPSFPAYMSLGVRIKSPLLHFACFLTGQSDHRARVMKGRNCHPDSPTWHSIWSQFILLLAYFCFELELSQFRISFLFFLLPILRWISSILLLLSKWRILFTPPFPNLSGVFE